ncbi:hypothetical protein [Marinobacterium arenosum]|uniref:hypothetical protein n=1 Tax=Marinobacterium arenosum TaxID=2862496 RepID=UPI001C982B5A|nr:hypothetical protein [Marinobacterium arenosum]MBY4676927.1 hypothetical protein [Marinobacterium arenosum]
MKWAIIILIMLSLIGSMMWVLPTRRERFQAQLRSQAKALGYHVQLAKVTAPRALGEMEAETYSVPAYRLLRTNIDSREREQLAGWQVFRVDSVANEGLPSGWSWGWGASALTSDQLALVNQVIGEMPDDVLALESTPIHVTAYWREEGPLSDLERIKSALDRILAARF